MNDKYLIQLPSKKSPQIKGSLIANFCRIYKYSPIYILLGEGTKKGEPDQGEIIQLFKTILKEVKNRNKDTDIIHDLLSGMIELKANHTEAHSKLVDKARKYNKS